MSYVLRHTMRFQATTLDGTIVIDLAFRYSLQIRLYFWQYESCYFYNNNVIN